MQYPKLFASTNLLVRREAEYTLNKYSKLLKWQKNENILDIGPGDGGVTLDIIVPRLPKTFQKLIGLDISKDMVTFAQNQTSNPKINFIVSDLCKPSSPTLYKNYFHHIFSFFCLHWIPNQKLALRNMNNMLKPQGQAIMTCIVDSPPFDAYKILAKSEEWGPYITNLADVLSPYLCENDPVNAFKNNLTLTGFTCQDCQLEEKYFTFEDEVFKGFMQSINPFVKNVPNNKKEAFVTAYINEIKKIKTVKTEDDGKVNYPYSFLTAFASKE